MLALPNSGKKKSKETTSFRLFHRPFNFPGIPSRKRSSQSLRNFYFNLSKFRVYFRTTKISQEMSDTLMAYFNLFFNIMFCFYVKMFFSITFLF